MNLSFEHDEELWHMEVEKTDKPMPDGISGARMFNRILLAGKYFDDFIMALAVDDFEAVRAIIGMVMDMQTKELCFKNDLQRINEIQDRPTSYTKELF